MRPLAAVGGKGLFVKELEEALLARRADLAVHSAKDLPARPRAGHRAGGVPRARRRRATRSSARRRGACLAGLARGARVGTGSLRRRAQLLAARPDLAIVPLRGNVDTRLRKLESRAALDAVVLACAGLERLGLAARIDERIDPRAVLPAVGQGTLALQTRAGEALAADLAALDHAPTRAATLAERAFLVRLAGDCNVPLAAYARLEGDEIAARGAPREPRRRARAARRSAGAPRAARGGGPARRARRSSTPAAARSWRPSRPGRRRERARAA